MSADIIRAAGVKCFVYIDDFIVIEENPGDFDTAVDILRHQLKWVLSDEKIVRPARAVTYLGVRIDLDANRAFIPADKRDKMQKILDYAWKTGLYYTEARSLAGRISWMAQVIPEAAPFVRGFFELCKPLELARRQHRRLNLPLRSIFNPARQDAEWWKIVLALDEKELSAPIFIKDRKHVTWASDASHHAIGLEFEGRKYFVDAKDLPPIGSWKYGDIPKDQKHRAVQLLELLGSLLPIFLATGNHRLRERLSHKLLLAWTDNASVAFTICKNRAKTPTRAILLRYAYSCLRALRLESTLLSFWVPRDHNERADFISKLSSLCVPPQE
jgi:hypothetical protein